VALRLRGRPPFAPFARADAAFARVFARPPMVPAAVVEKTGPKPIGQEAAHGYVYIEFIPTDSRTRKLDCVKLLRRCVPEPFMRCRGTKKRHAAACHDHDRIIARAPLDADRPPGLPLHRLARSTGSGYLLEDFGISEFRNHESVSAPRTWLWSHNEPNQNALGYAKRPWVMPAYRGCSPSPRHIGGKRWHPHGEKGQCRPLACSCRMIDRWLMPRL
jgi:hypothetical protein